jgi:hypothetical protein
MLHLPVLLSILPLSLLLLPSLRRSILHGDMLLRTGMFHLLLDIRALANVLVEVADVAGDVVVGFEGEGDERDEADGEPFPVAGREGKEEGFG